MLKIKDLFFVYGGEIFFEVNKKPVFQQKESLQIPVSIR